MARARVLQTRIAKKRANGRLASFAALWVLVGIANQRETGLWHRPQRPCENMLPEHELVMVSAAVPILWTVKDRRTRMKGQERHRSTGGRDGDLPMRHRSQPQIAQHGRGKERPARIVMEQPAG